MKRTAGLLMISLVVFATFSALVQNVHGWSSFVTLNSHAEMTRDTFDGLGWVNDEIGNIPDYASEEEYTWYAHRVEERQEDFLLYYCGRCGTCKECTQGSLGGAELGAKSNIATARMYYEGGNVAEGRKYLGYAIHFIQDSVCPAHVFPFELNLVQSHFEWHAAFYYGSRDWSSRIETAPITPIISSEDLRAKIVQAAEMVLDLPCSYRRADGANIRDERIGDVPLNGWRMSEDDIGLCMAKAASLVKGAVVWATALQKGVVRNNVPMGLAKIDFEEGTEGAVIKSTIAGLKFTTTLGYDWLYCDIRTGHYNARSLTDPSVNFGDYVVNGYFAAWLGVSAGQGRIDFILGPASYFSVLTSTYSGLCLEAYDSNDDLIATSGWAGGNLYTYAFTRLTVTAEGIAYVLVHDTGNYWEIDDIVTDAPSWGSRISSENIKKIPQRFEMNLIEGSWTTPDSIIEIDIYDINMRTPEQLTELAPQATDTRVANFPVVLDDMNDDERISPEEILQNILKKIPEAMLKEFIKYITQQIYNLNLELPSPDYGQNLLTQIFDFGSTVVVPTVETYGPYVIAILVLPVAISSGFSTFGLGGYQATITGIYVPTNALLGTTGDVTTTMYSHGDLVIINSEGEVLCKEFSQILGGTYIEVDLNGDGSPDDVAVLPATTECYTVNIVPDADASPDDTFTLTMAHLGIYFDLVRDLHFSDVPEHGYGLQASMPPTDSTPPTINVQIPAVGQVVQDGIGLTALVSDPSGVEWVTFSIREDDGEQGTIIGPKFESMPATQIDDDTWQIPDFNTYQPLLPDGDYLLIARASDALGNEGFVTVRFSIRNWAVLELLPSTPNSKAGRTMPIKFSIRVAASVDPNQPFVYNEELTIKIYKKASPSNILLRTSTFGTASTDYWIDLVSEKYHTNFKTLSTPATYLVEIYRRNMLIASFEFKTVK